MNSVAIDTVWVVVAGCLVLLMQAGFAALEMGLSRMKHSGAVAAKIIVNFALAIVVFWAIGYAIAFGDGSSFAGATGWFLERYRTTFRPPEKLLARCERNRPASPHYLARRERGGTLARRWNLYLPAAVMEGEPDER